MQTDLLSKFTTESESASDASIIVFGEAVMDFI